MRLLAVPDCRYGDRSYGDVERTVKVTVVLVVPDDFAAAYSAVASAGPGTDFAPRVGPVDGAAGGIARLQDPSVASTQYSSSPGASTASGAA